MKLNDTIRIHQAVDSIIQIEEALKARVRAAMDCDPRVFRKVPRLREVVELINNSLDKLDKGIFLASAPIYLATRPVGEMIRRSSMIDDRCRELQKAVERLEGLVEIIRKTLK